MTSLHDKLQAAARSPVLLVASDFDGTIAPIVEDPSQARADPAALAALRELADLPHTHAALVSGRPRDFLGRVMGADAAAPGGARGDAGQTRVILIGSHGVESSHLPPPMLTEPQRKLLSALTLELAEMAREDPGLFVEVKPFGVALHYRRATPAAAATALARVEASLAKREGVHVRHGSMVVELNVALGDKGRALLGLRHRLGATTVIFIGDDLTDEDAFAVLPQGDLTIKVGPGPTEARARVPDTTAVTALLTDLVKMRRQWLSQRTVVPIERHAVLSDQRTIAVLTPAGRVTWLCLPRIDSPALFADLLGGPSAGFFDIAPHHATQPVAQEYDGDSFILRTRWPGVTVTDYFDCSGGRAFQRAGRSDLIRVVEAADGAEHAEPARVLVRFAPRLDFGRTVTRLRIHEAEDDPSVTGVEIEGSPDPVVLICRAPSSVPLAWKILDDGRHHTAFAEVDASHGPVVFELRYGSASLRRATHDEAHRREQTHNFWSGWASTLRVPASGPVPPELLRRSALVIKALCHGPTGSIAAAGTTSLPEHMGGQRNWDYRFCWPRDASLAAAALVRLGSTGHAIRLLDWLLGIVDSIESPDRIRPIYTVTGRHLPPEAEIAELPGYADSAPVRISNAAAAQVQLDVFGPIVDLVALLAEHGAPVSPEHWHLVRAMVRAVESRWRDPDHGIWEIRGPRQHHVHSKVMCWHTVNRALLVEEYLFRRRNPEWEALRDTIAADVLSAGWNPEAADGRGAFTTAYGSPFIDAAALQIGLTGLLPPNDPRFVATVRAVETYLRKGPTVYRYIHDDGLPGIEGGFHLCTGWLIEAYALKGRLDDAEELLERFAALAGPTGLLSEEYDPAYDLALGNYPQAYSHLALINAAVAVDEARRRH